MQTAVRLTAIVQPGGRLEMQSPELPEGAEVEVIALLPKNVSSLATAKNTPRPSALEIIAGLNGHRLFASAAEVDTYLETERDSWER